MLAHYLDYYGMNGWENKFPFSNFPMLPMIQNDAIIVNPGKMDALEGNEAFWKEQGGGCGRYVRVGRAVTWGCD